MKLIPVQSSNVAAIGYLEDEQLLIVRYRDGALYAFPGVAERTFVILLNSPSRGEFLRQMTETGHRSVRVSQVHQTPPERVPCVDSGPLNVIDEDADKCCRAYLLRNFSGMPDDPIKNPYPSIPAEYICQHCSTLFRAEMVGPNRYWRIVPQVHIVKGTR